MKKNLVITAAVGLKVEQLTLFIKSLRKYYQNDVCFVIGEADHELEKELIRNQIFIIKTKISKKAIQFKRYEIFLNFLKNKKYENILCCDSRDIYFQSDPFNFNYKGKINFFLEDKKIKDCPFNKNWIIKTYGEKQYEEINEKIILCSGTVMGSQSKIIEYFTLIINNISKFKYKRKLKYSLTFRIDPEGRGCDQGHANYIVHKKLIKNINLYKNSSGPFATVFYLKNIYFNKKNELLNSSNDPYILVHQYDKRWDEFKSNVNEIRKKIGIDRIL
ncbi:MAG: hypothetical protein CMJ01_03350 [Pelagibacteraceae bacterium]|nr:hypothetical protein [Pelagibacteraceae bacterium]|tara:strand:+ start:9945 stop:10769 length:825 start_codon:yes stop_codon:yes gene_type:complete